MTPDLVMGGGWEGYNQGYTLSREEGIHEPRQSKQYSQADLAANFERVYEEAKSIFE